MKKYYLISLMAVLAAVGCHRENGRVKGMTPSGKMATVLAIKAGDTAPKVVVRGIMIEKCPAAGCWFKIQDNTGVLKVDTKAAGFVVLDVPLRSEVTVAGKVSSEGDETILEAVGVRF